MIAALVLAARLEIPAGAPASAPAKAALAPPSTAPRAEP